MRVRLNNVVSGSQDFTFISESPPSWATGSSGSTDDRKKRPPKPRYTQADLPFPHGLSGEEGINRWRSSFIPSLLSWAGAQDDPFGTNCRLEMNPSELVNIWERVYPGSTLDDKGLNVVAFVVRPRWLRVRIW